MRDEIPEIENVDATADLAAEVEVATDSAEVIADATDAAVADVSSADEVIEPLPETLVLRPGPVVPEAEPKKTSAAKAAAKDAAAQEEASQSPFSVTVGQVYDGPLDLLLDLIRKQNIDIYDIPIALLTAQFLDYCHQLKQTDVDAAGEFIYMASLLIHIKSKTLLPRDPSDVTGADSEDPRRELVERLLEHERFKAAAQMLMQKQQIEEATWSKPGLKDFLREQARAEGEATGMEQEIAADTVDLVRVFQEVLQRLKERPVLNVDEEAVTVAQMIDYVKRLLVMEDRPVSLRRLLHTTHSERSLICMFLAMLELVRLQAVLLYQPTQLGDILIKKTDGFDQVFAEQAAARDDWK
jgi:segregation and condensation protein A